MGHEHVNAFTSGDWVAFMPRAGELILWACAEHARRGLPGGPDAWVSGPGHAAQALAAIGLDADAWAADTPQHGCPTCGGDGCEMCLDPFEVAEHDQRLAGVRDRHLRLLDALTLPAPVTVRDLADLFVTFGLIGFDTYQHPFIRPDVDVASVAGLALCDEDAELLATRMRPRRWASALGALLRHARRDVAYYYRFDDEDLAALTGVDTYELELLAMFVNSDGPWRLQRAGTRRWAFSVDWHQWTREGRIVGHRLADELICLGAVDDEDQAAYLLETGVQFGQHPEIDDLI